MQRISNLEMRKLADINATTATHASYFPFMEDLDRIAYSCATRGWTGNLFRGKDSRLLYMVTDAGNENGNHASCFHDMGEREKKIMRNLERVEELEHSGAKNSVLAFIDRDGYRFTLSTFNHGHDWKIVG